MFQLLHRDRAHSANCAEDGVSSGAVLGSVGTCPLLCNDRLGWSRQFSLEVPQVQFLWFWFGAFCAIFRAPPVVPELSASFRSWGAQNYNHNDHNNHNHNNHIRESSYNNSNTIRKRRKKKGRKRKGKEASKGYPSRDGPKI